MTAPLAPFLTRFSAPLPALLANEAALAMPSTALITLTSDELDARIDAARQEAETLAERRCAAEIAASAQAHAAAMHDALAEARAQWCATEGQQLATRIDTAMNELRDLLSERIVAVLRPWLDETARTRAQQDLSKAMDRLLASEMNRSVRACGPDDLVAALRQARPNADIEWQVAQTIDVTLIADTTRLETRLAEMLSELATEDIHVG